MAHPFTEELQSKEKNAYPDLYVTYDNTKTVANILRDHMLNQPQLDDDPTPEESMKYMMHLFPFFECFYKHIHLLKDNNAILEMAIMIISEHVEAMALYDIHRAKMYFERIHSCYNESLNNK
jgi:hypothetical protein